MTTLGEAVKWSSFTSDSRGLHRHLAHLHFFNIHVHGKQPQVGRLLRIKGQPVGRGLLDGAHDEDGVNRGTKSDMTTDDPDWGWGAVVNMHKKPPKKSGEPANYEVEVLVMCEATDKAQGTGWKEPTPTTNGIQVVPAMRLSSKPLSAVRWSTRNSAPVSH